MDREFLNYICSGRDKMARNRFDHDNSHKKPKSRTYESALRRRNSESSSSTGELTGWELTQLPVLHDDIGIVEWIEDDKQILFNRKSSGMGCPLFWCKETLNDSRFRPTDAVTDPNDQLDPDHLLHENNPFYRLRTTMHPAKNLSNVQTGASDRKTSRHAREIRRFYLNGEMKPPNIERRLAKNQQENSSRNSRNKRSAADSVTNEPDVTKAWTARTARQCPQFLHSDPQLPISTICQFEKKLAAARNAKIEKGIEHLRQPFARKNEASSPKREQFNPSVISFKGGMIQPVHLPPLCDKSDSNKRWTKTLYRKYLQLLPIDKSSKQSTSHASDSTSTHQNGKVKSSQESDSTSTDSQFEYKSVKSGFSNQMEVHNSLFKFDVLEQYSRIRQTKTELSIEEHLCTLQREAASEQDLTSEHTTSDIQTMSPLSSLQTAHAHPFETVRAMWCDVQKDRLTARVSKKAIRLSQYCSREAP